MPNRNFDNITCFPKVLHQTFSDTIELIAIDTVNYSDGGVNFYTGVTYPGYSDGDYRFTIIQSDNLTTGYTVVPEEDIIGDISDYPYLKDLEITGPHTVGKALPFVQAKNLKRYVAIRIESSDVTSGCGLLMVMNLSSGEEPADRAGDQLNYHSFI